MTNFEKWKEEILKIKADDYEIAVGNGVPIPCIGICNQCEFEGKHPCIAEFVDWLLAEYQEPTPKLTKREREFLECFELKSDLEIMRACVSGMLFVVSKDSTFSQRISHNMFSFIEPYHTWTFEELMKLEVE